MIPLHYIKIANASRALYRANILSSKLYTTFLCNPSYHKEARFLVPTSHVRCYHNKQMTKIEKKQKEAPKASPTVSSKELVEKYVTSLNTDIYQKNRVYKNDFIRILEKIKECNFSTKKQGLLLIRCCGELMPDETINSRMLLIEELWKVLKPHTTFDIDHYNELLKVYISNKRTLTVNSFINQMAPVKPNIETYELMLRALGEAGDLNQATEVIANMKVQGLPATVHVFNSLIICQGKSGKYQNIQEVLTMMKSLKLEPTIETYTAKIRALAYSKQTGKMVGEMENAENKGLKFTEANIVEIVKTLAELSLYQLVPMVLKFLPDETLKTPSISPYMQSVTTQLVYENHPLVALEIYKVLPLPSFGPKDDKGLHGRSLVRDCVKASMPSSILYLITQELMSSGRNPIALHNATEAALQQGKVPIALDLLFRMKQLGIAIRPHYFWPLLLHSSKSYGEKGVINMLTAMMQMDIKPDYDTIMDYTLPFVSFTSPQNLMKKFVEAGLSVSSVLTPTMVTLLNTGQVRAASEICELFQGKVDAEKIIKPLVKGYTISNDLKSTIHTLEDVTSKAMDKNKDWVGRFLCKYMQDKKAQSTLPDMINLLQALVKSENLKISTVAADYCMSRLPEDFPEQLKEEFRACIINLTDETLIDDGDVFDMQMQHPKQMNEEGLRSHLIELEAKGMNTRGVLRKLLQQYCREGNLEAAREIADKCHSEGVFLSAGMKAAIFDLHVKLGELDLAEVALTDLNKSSPNFTLDEYKVIDFATLMVYREKIKQALDLISEQSKRRKIMGGRSIQMNCWRLLDATAANGTPTDVQRMFELLTSLGYCKPSNVMLGPLIRVYLKNDDLQGAVKEFVRLANKYHKTPLKHEMLCKILHYMSDGLTEDKFLTNEKSDNRSRKLVQTILSVDKQVHGASDVQLTLISALAEVGYKKTLRKMLLDPTVKFHPDAFMRRCERFADEKKVRALENIAECARDLRQIDVGEIYEMILDVYQRDDNYIDAIHLWNKLQEENISPSQKFIINICSLLKANNKEIPSDLALLQDKQLEVSKTS